MNRHSLLPALAPLWLAASAAGQDAPRLETLLAEAPAVEIRVLETRTEGDVVLQDLTFPSLTGGPGVEAWLVRPAGRTAGLAGLLYVHWFEPGAPTSNRTQFLDEARELARRGAVSLLVSTFWSDTARYRAREWQTDFRNSVAQARDLRRALDVLLAQPGVDSTRVGLVGHDYGGMFGIVVAAVDRRLKACSIIAAAPTFPEWYLFGSATGVPEGTARDRFVAEFRALDPVEVIGRARCSFFFQFGENDRYTPREGFIGLYRAAPEPKRLATYASGHDMAASNIRADRTAWLAERLGLDP